jgi:hypothetical protein
MRFLRALTLSHVLQTLLVVGLGILIWQTVLLRRSVQAIKLDFPSGRDRFAAIPVEVTNRSLTVDVDRDLDVNVTNEPRVHVSNSTLDVYVTNP